ncbi:LysR family transcriptional regulator [Variovorax guangxiensis]|uniref:DNA-binding transcriptional LysR family regulator n=1 Tax=Variovorax guangxiensis TaxID=1775474 RepID=A0A840G0N9_9BURK|nr:LysR family transcriptional regulator [Variovorax guangxiensis]MBB4224867.1 DNA-binding transcriptional LysR family regulator [Variovorax guangxiensis]
MTLVQLRHLVSLATTGSFTRSARETFVTQPALSRSIQALEDELGQPLFDRVGHHSELTNFGREIVRRARQLLIDADELVACGQRTADGGAGTLRVGLGSSPAAMLMVPILQLAAKHKPTLRVGVSHGDSSQLVMGLRNRDLDALVLEVRSLKPATDLRVETIVQMPGCFLCRPGHPLTRVRSTLSFEDLTRYPLASTLLDDDIARHMIEIYGPKAHPDHCLSLQSNDLGSLVKVIRESDAVMLAVPRAAPDLVALRVRPELPGGARFGLVTLADRAEAPAMPLLRKVLREVLAAS